jgi:hypothetical protein
MDIKIAQQETITELVLENQKLKRELSEAKDAIQILGRRSDEITEKYDTLAVEGMLDINKIYKELDKAKNALLEIVEQTDGRNTSHIGQDRAYSIALEATK